MHGAFTALPCRCAGICAVQATCIKLLNTELLFLCGRIVDIVLSAHAAFRQLEQILQTPQLPLSVLVLLDTCMGTGMSLCRGAGNISLQASLHLTATKLLTHGCSLTHRGIAWRVPG